MSENAPFYESFGAKNITYDDEFKSTGRTRKAWGFGSKFKKGTDTSFDSAVQSMRSTISDVDKFYEKEVGAHQWAQTPQSIKESVTEMGYIMGRTKIKKQFPSMLKALREGDYKQVGLEAQYVSPSSPSSKIADWLGHVSGDRRTRILSGFKMSQDLNFWR